MPLIRPTRLAFAIAVASIAAATHAENVTPNLRINGFLTAGATTMSNDFGGHYLDDGYSIKGFNEDGDTGFDNVLGLQVSYQLSDQVDLVGQVVSAGQNNYQTEADWAYVGYRANDNLRLRAGRFAAPFYMYSESLRVGQAYPWARTPIELYFGIPVKSLDGVDALYRVPLGDWNFDAQAYFGGSSAAFGRIEKTGGLNLNLSNGNLTLHAGYGAGKIDLDFKGDLQGGRVDQFEALMNAFNGTMDVSNDRVTFADIGTIYDDGNWFAAAEYGQLRIKDYANNFDAGYASVGHYFGKWLPYATYSKSNAVNSDGCYSRFSPTLANANNQATAAANASAAATATVNGLYAIILNPSSNAGDIALASAALPSALVIQAEAATTAGSAAQGVGMLGVGLQSLCNGKEQTSYSLGFRYDATKNVSLKAEVSDVRDFNNTTGFLTGVTPQQLQGESTQVFTFNVNASF